VSIQIVTPNPVIVSDTAAIANEEPTATAALAQSTVAQGTNPPVTSKPE
jgi:hypothetical protein